MGCAPAYLIYLLLVVYAAFLVTPAAALWVFFFGLLASLVMTLGAYYHFLPLPSVVHTPTTLYASYSAGMLIIVLIVLVITREYRDAFGRLRGSEERFRLMFEAPRDPIFLMDEEGRFLTCNDSAARMLGLPAPARSKANARKTFLPLPSRMVLLRPFSPPRRSAKPTRWEAPASIGCIAVRADKTSSPTFRSPPFSGRAAALCSRTSAT